MSTASRPGANATYCLSCEDLSCEDDPPLRLFFNELLPPRRRIDDERGEPLDEEVCDRLLDGERRRCW